MQNIIFWRVKPMFLHPQNTVLGRFKRAKRK